MKQAWKFTLTQKRQAVKDMRSLMAKGNSITKARTVIGRKLGVTPSTLYNWERALNGEFTNTTKSTVVRSNSHITGLKPHITSVNLYIPGKGDVTLDHDLLRSISELAGHVN